MIYKDFSQYLKKIRKELGFSSAKSFYDFLATKEDNLFNYSYYIKIEAGKVIPSPKVLSLLKNYISIVQYENLVKLHFVSQFPDCDHLMKNHHSHILRDEAKYNQPKIINNSFVEFTFRQVSILGKERSLYYIFILLTLARRSLSLKEIEEALGKRIGPSITKLVTNKLISREGNVYRSVSRDVKMPRAYNKEIKKIYEKFDLWDKELGEIFKFKNLKRKSLTKRISPRYVNLISSQIDLMIELIHTSSDLDTEVNESVVTLNLSLDLGELPG